MTTNHTARRPATLLAATLTAGALALIGPAASAAEPSPSGDTGWVRAGHLAPSTPKADLTLTPFSGGEPVTVEGVAFRDITDYLRVPADTYTLAIRPEGEPDAQPMVTASVEVEADSAATVVATGDDGPVGVQVIPDDLSAPEGRGAKVRLISAASAEEPVSARVVDGPVLAEDVTTGSATGYAEVAAQTWEIAASAGDTSAPASRIALEPGGVYTLLVVGDDEEGLRLSAIQDSSASGEMPRGGMDTGAGGAAPTEVSGALGGPVQTGVLAGGAAALGALVLAGAGVARRARA